MSNDQFVQETDLNLENVSVKISAQDNFLCQDTTNANKQESEDNLDLDESDFAAVFETPVKTWLQENREDLDLIFHLEDVASKNDAETEPFKSQYKSQEIGAKLLNSLNEFKHTICSTLCEGDSVPTSNITENHSNEENLIIISHFIGVQAALLLKMGESYITTEQRTEGDIRLTQAVSLIESVPSIGNFIRRVTRNWDLEKRVCSALTEFKCCLVLTGVLRQIYNMLGGLWSEDADAIDKAITYLKQAKRTYREWKGLTNKHFPETGRSLLGFSADKPRCFEDGFINSVFYMAQIYSRSDKVEDKDKSAKYCHITLRLQLDSMQYDPLDWALNCATLSQYYVGKNRFEAARYCIYAAQTILKEAEKPDEDGSIPDNVVQAQADIKRCWAKYGMALLDHSWERLGDDDIILPSGKQKQVSLEPFFDTFNLELPGLSTFVGYEWTRTFDEARPVFLFIQENLNSAKKFYTEDSQCTEYIKLVQDHSKAFRLLTNFETSFERQCRMHKRRIDMLKDIFEKLNTQHYLMSCRQLTFELAETTSHMFDLKMSMIENKSHPDKNEKIHAIRKANYLIKEAIYWYSKFLDLHRDFKDGTMPKVFDKDSVRPVLIAHFCMARLYGKYLETDTRSKLEKLHQSEIEYRYVVDYCIEHPEIGDLIREELDIAREMVQLMPAKMAAIQSAAGNA